MVSISVETPAQSDERLRRVIAVADLDILPGEWAFRETPPDQPPTLTDDLLAVVRDADGWSCLGPAAGDEPERFAVFSFHFPADVDNSGFVGWLASTLKRELGTGVVVVCGYNHARGGVYDYWAAPSSLRKQVIDVVAALRR
ncbi:DUF6196 family protein [Plantactinospora sp. GCM10030261]|uniref:DUF6196 family protein n=1 Tax=Plantactinospora sp. GCM10030261 TaxID=3273420 RepID=UPI003619AD74